MDFEFLYIFYTLGIFFHPHSLSLFLAISLRLLLSVLQFELLKKFNIIFSVFFLLALSKRILFYIDKVSLFYGLFVFRVWVWVYVCVYFLYATYHSSLSTESLKDKNKIEKKVLNSNKIWKQIYILLVFVFVLFLRYMTQKLLFTNI